LPFFPADSRKIALLPISCFGFPFICVLTFGLPDSYAFTPSLSREDRDGCRRAFLFQRPGSFPLLSRVEGILLAPLGSPFVFGAVSVYMILFFPFHDGQFGSFPAPFGSGFGPPPRPPNLCLANSIFLFHSTPEPFLIPFFSCPSFFSVFLFLVKQFLCPGVLRFGPPSFAFNPTSSRFSFPPTRTPPPSCLRPHLKSQGELVSDLFPSQVNGHLLVFLRYPRFNRLFIISQFFDIGLPPFFPPLSLLRQSGVHRVFTFFFPFSPFRGKAPAHFYLWAVRTRSRPRLGQFFFNLISFIPESHVPPKPPIGRVALSVRFLFL